MDRKIIIEKLHYLYKLRKIYGYQKNVSKKDFDELNKIRNMIYFYEGLIKSNYHDTWIESRKIKLKKNKCKKKKEK